MFWDFLIIDSKFSSVLNRALKLIMLMSTSSTYPVILNPSFIVNFIEVLKSHNILADTNFTFNGFIMFIWKLPKNFEPLLFISI